MAAYGAFKEKEGEKVAKNRDALLKNGKNTRFKSGSEAARKAGRKGGQNSGKSRNETKLIKEALVKMLKEEDGYKKMAEVAMREMENGNAKFWELIRDTIGEKPKDEIVADVDTDITINIELTDE